MTNLQRNLYWRTWSKYVAAMGWKNRPSGELDQERHAMHFRVLEKSVSSKKLTNSELDKVLAEMWVVTNLDNVNKQVRQARQSRTRAEWTIEQFPEIFPDGREAAEEYLRTILRDRFGGRAVISLSDAECAQLAMTLNNRRKSLASQVRLAESATESTASDDPF